MNFFAFPREIREINKQGGRNKLLGSQKITKKNVPQFILNLRVKCLTYNLSPSQPQQYGLLQGRLTFVGTALKFCRILFCSCNCLYSYFKKGHIVNSRYWKWVSSSTGNILLLALTLHNIECRFIVIPRPYSNNLRWRVITF